MYAIRSYYEDVFFKVNPADLCAAEIALQLKEQHGAEVTYLSFGPPRVEKTLRECLSLGGDHAVRIWDSSIAPGSQGKTYLLAKVIQSLEADLVLCGSQSLDEGRGETPAALAELLDLVITSYIIHYTKLYEIRCGTVSEMTM